MSFQNPPRIEQALSFSFFQGMQLITFYSSRSFFCQHLIMRRNHQRTGLLFCSEFRPVDFWSLRSLRLQKLSGWFSQGSTEHWGPADLAQTLISEIPIFGKYFHRHRWCPCALIMSTKKFNPLGGLQEVFNKSCVKSEKKEVMLAPFKLRRGGVGRYATCGCFG